MVQKSRGPGRTPIGPAAPAKPEPGARSRASTSDYNRFWHCMSGGRPGDGWAGGDVAPLSSLTRAFGLAEEQKPLSYPSAAGVPGPGGKAAPPSRPKRR